MKIISTKTTIGLTEKEIRMIQNVYNLLDEIDEEVFSVTGNLNVNKEDIMNWILEYDYAPENIGFMVISEEDNKRSN